YILHCRKWFAPRTDPAGAAPNAHSPVRARDQTGPTNPTDDTQGGEAMSAVPPATLEGWYALHQMFALDWAALRRMDEKDRESLAREAEELLDSLTRP